MTSFRDLHDGDEPLVLANAWDVGSALAFATAGFPAIGTTSFGMAASHGRPDGDRASMGAITDLARELVRLPVHISLDIEDGYSDDPEEVAGFVADLAALGVAGINLEDSRSGHLIDPGLAAAKITAVRQQAPDIFINARVDNFWFAQDASIAAVLQRAQAYAEAGADGIFIPGALGAEQIGALTGGIALPVNVLAHPVLTVTQLGELGVRRVSSGSLPYRYAMDSAVNAVAALRDGQQLPAATAYWDFQSRLEAFAAGPTT